jgi:hypothetical protein
MALGQRRTYYQSGKIKTIERIPCSGGGPVHKKNVVGGKQEGICGAVGYGTKVLRQGSTDAGILGLCIKL